MTVHQVDRHQAHFINRRSLVVKQLLIVGDRHSPAIKPLERRLTGGVIVWLGGASRDSFARAAPPADYANDRIIVARKNYERLSRETKPGIAAVCDDVARNQHKSRTGNFSSRTVRRTVCIGRHRKVPPADSVSAIRCPADLQYSARFTPQFHQIHRHNTSFRLSQSSQSKIA